jgi:hypothetical protein
VASDIEIERIRKDAERWKSLVQQLLRYDDSVLEQKDSCFLDSLSLRDWLDELSYLQAEWLLDIRDSVQIVPEFRGYSVRYLVRCCYENRFGFDSEDDQAWLVELYQSGKTSIRKNQAKRLYYMAKDIGEVEDWAA